jgi:hypothetical protein
MSVHIHTRLTRVAAEFYLELGQFSMRECRCGPPLPSDASNDAYVSFDWLTADPYFRGASPAGAPPSDDHCMSFNHERDAAGAAKWKSRYGEAKVPALAQAIVSHVWTIVLPSEEFQRHSLLAHRVAKTASYDVLSSGRSIV